jgi:hypothetical protein
VANRVLSTAVLLIALTASSASWAMARVSGTVHMAPYASLGWFMAGFELGAWEDYLVSELTPDLERLSSRELPHVTWLKLDEAVLLPEFARPLLQGHSRVPLRLSFRQTQMGSLLGESLTGGLQELESFRRSIVMSGVTHSVTPTSDLTVSAILASQRFGTANMNLQPATNRGTLPVENDDLLFDPVRSEVSHGTGLRLALSSELTTGVRLEAAFQSRVNMDDFASMRGVHGASAELDIPPRLQVGVELHATPRSWFNFGVSQIFYSDVGAFPSRSLPARFTALLGDRNSPIFAWDDLTVYSLGWRWLAADDVELFVDYQTRTQPSPSAPTLAAALDSELASNAFMAGLSKGVGENSRLHLNAAYAPPEYAFGGNLLGVVSEDLDQGLEVQAMLSFDF